MTTYATIQPITATIQIVSGDLSIEASDQVPFEDYRREYTSPERLGTGARAVLAGAESV